MELNHFHFNQSLLPLRKKLMRNDLSLIQLRSIEDEALLMMSDGEDDLGGEILASIHQKRDFLVRKERIKISEFSAEEPIALEFDPGAIESTFSSRMGRVAKMIRQKHSITPYKKNLNPTQQREISEIAGPGVSPEVLAHAVDIYVGKLREQIKAAESFYFGRIKEGIERLSRLSEKVRQRVDQMVWQATDESEVYLEVVIAAILHSVEEQMGMHEDVA